MPLACLLLAACAPVVTWHGNTPSPRALESLTPGVDTREAVAAKLGPPTVRAPLSERRWYYVGYAMEKKGPRDARPVKDRVLVVAFTEDGTLEGTDLLESARVDVPHNPSETPVRGTEKTIAQEILGNIGKFVPAGVPGSATDLPGS
ncbi:MAG TPA: hypothetical protein DDX54_00120 [Rhodospirillaceae bacterium]|jgi:outer membrane protein assembly factor BamE (lipoprotein component of BamABCDE complex)|nr:hypothetical protein [Rhodospirillaceae bacterium]